MTSKIVSSDGQIQRLRTCSECRLSFSNWEENPLSNSKIWTTYHQTLAFKFASVCEVDNQNFDLRMEISPGYRAKPAASQVVGDMLKLNMAVGNNATVKFTLLQGETIADPATVNSILFSVLDLDKGHEITHQWLTAPGVNNWVKGSQVDTSTSAGGVAKFVATRQGNGGDNPQNSMDLAPEALGSTVALQYSSTEWNVTLGIDGGDPSGRFFFLGGATSLKETFCTHIEPPTPAPPAPSTKATCQSLLVDYKVWGYTARGIDLGNFTNQTFKWMGCMDGRYSCPSDEFYCQGNGNTLEWGHKPGTQAMRAVLGNEIISHSYDSRVECCGDSRSPSDADGHCLLNSPDKPADVQALCTALGFTSGTVEKLTTNSCPEAHWDGATWTHDFAGSAGHGKVYKCTG